MREILSISVASELTHAIKQQARKERRTVSEVAREALRRYLDTLPKTEETTTKKISRKTRGRRSA